MLKSHNTYKISELSKRGMFCRQMMMKTNKLKSFRLSINNFNLRNSNNFLHYSVYTEFSTELNIFSLLNKLLN